MTSNDLYSACVLTKNIDIHISQLGNNVEELLHNKLVSLTEGKCTDKGYVKLGSVRIKTYSNGSINNTCAQFVVVYECMIFNSTVNMELRCKVIENTRSAGVRAFSDTENPSPFVAYLIKDHNYNNDKFNKLVVNDIINVKVSCFTFEIDDPMVSVIGVLI
jgi:DNA-directed RNA polymerase subunit E'/Rpb7